jgi:hypothetical protein
MGTFDGSGSPPLYPRLGQERTCRAHVEGVGHDPFAMLEPHGRCRLLGRLVPFQRAGFRRFNPFPAGEERK